MLTVTDNKVNVDTHTFLVDWSGSSSNSGSKFNIIYSSLICYFSYSIAILKVRFKFASLILQPATPPIATP